MGLCAFDDPQMPSLQNGIEYLIRTQNADGTWTEPETTGTGFPRVFYLKYRHVPQQLAVAGIGNVSQFAGVLSHSARVGRQVREGKPPSLQVFAADGIAVPLAH